MSAIWFAVLLLGTVGRLTRLVTDDHITAPLRAKVISRFGAESNSALFIRCPWCVSFWVALAAVPLAVLAAASTPYHRLLHDPGYHANAGDVLAAIATALAIALTLSYAVGLLSTLDAD